MYLLLSWIPIIVSGIIGYILDSNEDANGSLLWFIGAIGGATSITIGLSPFLSI